MAEEESKSSANIKPMHILLVFAAISVLAIFTGYGYSATTITANVIKVPYDVQVPYDAKENYDVQEPYTETVCNNIQVPYSDKECESKPLVYSIEDFVIASSVCNEREEICHQSYPIIGCTDKTVYCIDRTVTCSLKLNNLDDERGSWTINFNFLKVGSSSVDATDTASMWLYPHTSNTFVGRGRITTKELFDTSYTCKYSVPNKATKQVCRDVTKYRTVQDCKDVTKYRTVTKERTITKHRREIKQREETQMETVKKYPQIAAFIDNILH